MIHQNPRDVSRKEYFCQEAENWDQKYITTELETFLEKLIPQFGLQSGQTILDAGTGTGVLIPFLIKAIGATGSITAIDYSEKMVKKFQSKFSHLQNVKVELKDVETLNLPLGIFDAAICFGLFPHLEHKTQALRNLKHVLKKGGRLVIAHALSSAEIKDHHKGMLSVAQDLLPEEIEMKGILKKAGFSNIHIRDEPGLYLCLATKNTPS